MDEEDYAAYLPSSSNTTDYNPIEKFREYKIKKQGYQRFVDEDDDDESVASANVMRTSKPKLIRMRKDGSVKGYAPPIPDTHVHDNRPRKIRVRTDGIRRAPSPYKQSESDSDDLIDMHSQASSSSSSSEATEPFANWQKFD